MGRQVEIDALSSLLRDRHYRLLTLVGAGGVGKTRLAVHLMQQLRDQFADGVYFVDLQTSLTIDDLITTTASILKITLSGQEAPEDQLVRFLQRKQMLLVLDNFEQLLASAHLLSKIILQTPSVVLLVTSREALNLSEEYRYILAGLEVPLDGDAKAWMTSDSVRLFAERARRVRRGFSLDEERESVVRICQLVEGIPLAIEIAASWVSSLSCVTIAAEIQRNLHFLQSRLRDVPERHRSIQAIFEQSWQQLTEDERRVFMRLSVFRGGFGRASAQAVAGMTLPILSALLDKSLLEMQEQERYHIHELLRQYVEAKLAQSALEHIWHVREQHATYYMRFLAERTADVIGGRQKDATAEIETELDNLRAAWKWAVAQKQIETIADATFTWYSFCQFSSRYLEAARMLEMAAKQLDGETLSACPRAVIILTCLGWFYIRLGRFEEAQQIFLRACAAYPRLNSPADTPYDFDPSVGLGLLAAIRGDRQQAERLLESALRTSEEHQRPINLMSVHYALAGLRFAQGEYRRAQKHAQAGCAAARALQSSWFMAYCLIELGNASAALGDYASAAKEFETSYAIRAEFNDAEGMAVALNALGEVALQQGDAASAQRRFEESLTLYHRIDDKGGLATTLHGLGRTAVARNDPQTACQMLLDALQTATDIQFVPLVLAIVVSVGELVTLSANAPVVRIWLNFVSEHPSTDKRLKMRAAKVRAQLDENNGSSFPDVRSPTLQDIIDEVQAELILVAERSSEDRAYRYHIEPQQEILTEQEYKVLQLLAQGLTNTEIADVLTVVVGTVKTHNHHIYSKLGVDNRTQAIIRARELHLI